MHVDRFGGEGTGAKTKFYYDWKTGVPQRFLVRSKIISGLTNYSAYFLMNNKWKFLATIRHATDKTGTLTGVYSFLENWSSDISKPRRCQYGPYYGKAQRSANWVEILKANVTRSGYKEPCVWDAGVQDDRFFLHIDGPLSELHGHKPTKQDANFLVKRQRSVKCEAIPFTQ